MTVISPTTHRGSCYCGSVSFRFDGDPSSVVNCHCGQCRRLSGAAFTTWASVSRGHFVLSGQDGLSRFAATRQVTRHFCNRCGSHVFTDDLRLPNIVGIPTGAIEDGGAMAPSAHYFVDHRAAWVSLDDGVPRFGGESGVAPIRD